MTYQKGWWVRVRSGKAGVIVSWPEKMRGFTMEVSSGPNAQCITDLKTSIVCRENPNTFCAVPVPHLSQRPHVHSIDGKDSNYASDREDE